MNNEKISRHDASSKRSEEDGDNSLGLIRRKSRGFREWQLKTAISLSVNTLSELIQSSWHTGAPRQLSLISLFQYSSKFQANSSWHTGAARHLSLSYFSLSVFFCIWRPGTRMQESRPNQWARDCRYKPWANCLIVVMRLSRVTCNPVLSDSFNFCIRTQDTRSNLVSDTHGN
jgi:hypothetical protein